MEGGEPRTGDPAPRNWRVEPVGASPCSGRTPRVSLGTQSQPRPAPGAAEGARFPHLHVFVQLSESLSITAVLPPQYRVRDCAGIFSTPMSTVAELLNRPREDVDMRNSLKKTPG